MGKSQNSKNKTKAKIDIKPKKGKSKASTKQTLLISLFILLGTIILATSIFWSYKVANRNAAPEVIKQIRKEPFYDYQSENLRIVRRHENFGGVDQKGAEQPPALLIYYDYTGDIDPRINELVNSLHSLGYNLDYRDGLNTQMHDRTLNISINGNDYRIMIGPSFNNEQIVVSIIFYNHR